MLRTLYISQSTIDPATLDGEVASIVETSVRNNRPAQLTGMLLTHDGWFLQALEGPDRAVEAAMDRIRRDPRHKAVKVLAMLQAKERVFGDWNMCARTLNQVDAEILATLDSRKVQLSQIGAAAAERLLTVVKTVRADAARRLVGSVTLTNA
jgi:hypothetical protein